jgi:hypothetical protein
MRHRRDVLDALSPIDRSTVNFVSVFDTPVDVAADPKWGRQANVTTCPAATKITRWIRAQS